MAANGEFVRCWIIGSTLYLRVGDATRSDFEAEGAHPFKYMTQKGEVTVRKFYTALP